MLSQLLNMGPRRLFAISLVLGGALLAVLLIVLWQLGVFDSPPPPAALQSAVESIRQEEQQEQPALTQQQQADEPAVEDSAQEQTAAQQDDADQQQSAYAQDQPHQAEQQQSADAYGYGSQQQEQEQPQQADEQSTQQQTQQQAEQQSSQESQEQQVMTPEDPSLQDLAGTWTISDRGISFVGYRIGEELANIGTATAVGRTSDIVATLEFDGVTITAVTIEADLRTLKSDEGFRDSALRTRGIEIGHLSLRHLRPPRADPDRRVAGRRRNAERHGQRHARSPRCDQPGKHRPARPIRRRTRRRRRLNRNRPHRLRHRSPHRIPSPLHRGSRDHGVRTRLRTRSLEPLLLIRTSHKVARAQAWVRTPERPTCPHALCSLSPREAGGDAEGRGGHSPRGRKMPAT